MKKNKLRAAIDTDVETALSKWISESDAKDAEMLKSASELDEMLEGWSLDILI